MKKLLLIIFFIGFYSSAQKVSNITTHQEQSTIIVSYDLETKLPCKVSLYVSINGGTTWQGPLTKVKGDVGNKIISGKHSITWSVLEEFDELKGENIKFQVRAKSDKIETVKIGTQEWTTKNLNVSTYSNGDVIPEVTDPKVWANLTTGAWCYYDNDPKNEAIYGKLYNGYAVNDPRGLAPEGYHIPLDLEWNILIKYLGGEQVAGGKMKSNDLWRLPNSSATNESGFTGIPSGYRSSDGTFYGIGYSIRWWSTTRDDSFITLHFNTGSVYRHIDNKKTGNSVRCIKD